MTIQNCTQLEIDIQSRVISKQLSGNIFIDNCSEEKEPDHWYDVIITESLSFIRMMSKKYPSTLFVFVTHSGYVKVPANTISYTSDFFKEENISSFISTVSFASARLKEALFRKVAGEIHREKDLFVIQRLAQQLGFLLHVIQKDTTDDQYDLYLMERVGHRKNGFIFDKVLLRGFFFNRHGVLYFFESLWLINSDLSRDLLKELKSSIRYSKIFSDRKKKHDKDLVSAVGSLEKERFLAEHIGEGFFIEDLSGKIYFVNKMFRKMFPFKKNMIFGCHIQDVMHAGEQFNLIELWDKGDYNPFSVIFKGNYFGDDRYYEVTYSPVIQHGEIKNFCGIISDITVEKKLEGALRLSHDKLELMNSRLVNVQNATILGFSKLAEYKDMETGGHLERIQTFVKVLTNEIHKREIFIDFDTKQNYISSDYVEELSLSSLLHDIGKVGIPDIILQKPGRLTHDEFMHMQLHAKIGGDTLSWLNETVGEETFLALAKEVAYYHHEKWNGSGYPFGLKEEGIPLSARLIAICDVYDALTSNRSYKNAYSHEKACDIIYNSSGTHFDPILISAFSSVEEQFKSVRKKFSD